MIPTNQTIGQMQAAFITNGKKNYDRTGVNTDKVIDNFVKEIKNNFAILVMRNVDFIVGQRPDWYKTNPNRTKDVEVNWTNYGGNKIRCIGGDVLIQNKISWKDDYTGKTVESDKCIPIFMLTNRVDPYWSVPTYFLSERSPYTNPFLYPIDSPVYVKDMLEEFLGANDGTSWNRFDLANLHDYYVYRIFSFHIF